MLRLFLRLYLFLMLPATVAFVMFMYITDQVMAQIHAEEQRARAGTAFDRAERILGAKEVPNSQGRLHEIEQTFRIEHQIIPYERAEADWFMSGSEKERLRAGDIAFRDRPGGGQVYLRKMRDSDRVLRIEWVGAYEYLMVYYTIIIALVTLAMCAILWRWVKPFWRDLEDLKAATARVGAGDFEVRARVAKTSLLEPIASAFNSMTERVHALINSHRDLEQGVAHELRTPLAQLKFDAELAHAATNDQEREDRFAAIARDVEDLEDLVNELLVLANLREAPPYTPEAIPTRMLLDEVMRRANDEMRASGRAVAIDAPRNVPDSLTCDVKYLSRALVNVVRNAVRYAHSRVALTIERVGGQTVINVDDDGPGVPPAERERLFEPFTRLDESRDRGSGGMGLGLAIVRSVAQWHGGSARITDSPLGGARVSIVW